MKKINQKYWEENGDMIRSNKKFLDSKSYQNKEFWDNIMYELVVEAIRTVYFCNKWYFWADSVIVDLNVNGGVFEVDLMGKMWY